MLHEIRRKILDTMAYAKPSCYRSSIILILMAAMTFVGCNGNMGTNASFPTTQDAEQDDNELPTKPTPKPDKPDEPCHYNGHQLHIGKKGGCYYLYDGKKREYVDRSYCDSCPHKTKASKADTTGK
jgi:hypothetical protein